MAGQTETFDFSANGDVEILPGGYEKNESGIFRVETREKSDGTECEVKIPLCYTPIKVSAILENPDTGEVSYKITFPVPNGTKTVTIAGSELFQKKGIMQLAGQGVLVAEGMARGLTEYLVKMVAINKIPVQFIFDRFGWKDDGFVFGKTMFTPKNKIPITLSVKNKQAEAITAEGTIKEWINAVSGVLRYDNQRFKLYTGVSAPILKNIDEANYSLNDFGDTTIGKSLTTLVVMSIFGEPYSLQFSGDTTKVGIERTVTMFCDLPVNLDDCQNIDKKTMESIVYMMGNGVGKVRGAKMGGLQEVLSWRTVGLFTSEDPIVKDTSFGGLSMRLLEVSGGLGKTDVEAVSKFESGVRKNYGVFAPILIEYLIKNKDEVQKLHTESLKTLSDTKSKYAMNPTLFGIAGRMTGVFATVLTAGKIFEKLYGQIGGEEKNPEFVVITVFEKLLRQKEFDSYVQRGLDHILSWISANKSNFLEDGERTTVYTKDDSYKLKYKIYGNITNEYYDILPSELKTELERAKFSLERLMADFKNNEWLETDKGKNQKTTRFEGNPTKVYRLKRNFIESFEEEKNK